MFPGQFRNVHQTVDSTEIHECTEVDNRGNGTGTDLALLQCLQEVGASFGLCLFQPSTAGQDNVVTVLIQFNDFGFELLSTYGAKSRTRRISTKDAGKNPRRPMSRIRPPLTTSITVPVTTPSSSLTFSM